MILHAMNILKNLLPFVKFAKKIYATYVLPMKKQ